MKRQISSPGISGNHWKQQLDDNGVNYKIIEWTIEKILPEPLQGLALVLKK